ncbi:uncharacterized protein DUF4192 [Haloactinospora alba]|uniref:Uncharacterized protein DUF4192 n=1 Tax=Haloactinospora alba TaxID=405555 RepID=A0A543NKQ8_9ACTN|nr:DUF4192 domain-containing protein [Haloactinospora alba]TQN32396.1 uncharacterized protein DUF4192 [Haloactinospora alba]
MLTNGSSEPAPHPLTLGTPTDIIAAVPYILGYHPADTAVVLGLGAPSDRLRVTLRCDLQDALPEPGNRETDPLAEVLRAQCHAVLIVGYGTARRVTPCVDALRASAASAGVPVREALRVTEGRYWSYTCDSAECCPPAGTAYDPDSSHVPAAAVASGLTAWSGLHQINAFLEPVRGPERERVRRATREAERRGGRLFHEDAPEGEERFGTELRRSGVRTVRAAVAAARNGEFPTRAADVAWLGLVLTCIRVRDEAWAHIGGSAEEVAAQLQLWRCVVRRVEPEYVPAPGSLLAVAAWNRRDIALAEAALAMVQEADPHYSMAGLVREALRLGVPWKGFTPQWLEEVWPVAGPEEGGGG